MSVTLRPYQSDAVDSIRGHFKQGKKRVLFVLPTGGGKTETFIHIAEQAMSRNKKVFFLVHKKNLVRQISERCNKYNLEHGIIAGGHKKNYQHAAQVCSVQTLKNRLDEVPVPDLIIIDEAHHASAGTWKAIMEFYSDVFMLGVTATPWRLDGKGLGDMFEQMVLGPPIAELIKMGNLVMPSYYMFKKIEALDNLKQNNFGEYDLGEISDVMTDIAICGDIVKEYRRLADGEPAIYSCSTIHHAQEMAKTFRLAGYTSEAVHGEQKDEEVDRIFKGLADRTIQVVTFCNLISEGTDIPAVAVVGMLRPTASLSLYLQIVGRGLRPCAGKDKCIILDHVNNMARHKHPLTPRVWDLDGIKKKNKKKNEVEDSYNVCQSCYAVFEKTEECCPECGLIPEAKQREQKTIENAVAVKDERSLDDFLSMHKVAQPVRKQLYSWECKTLEELWEFKESKGYKDFWVKHIFESKVLKETEDGNKNIYQKWIEPCENLGWSQIDGYQEYMDIERVIAETDLLETINNKYKINAVSLSQTDVQAAIDKAWGSFYGWKKVENKNNFKKSYNKY
jgi:superfamily II DNA or RNA helicase